MADKNILGQMLEHLVNNEKDKAEELFHEYVVARSRDIYEGLIENEIAEEEDKEEDEEVDEAAEKDEDESEEDLDENFEDIAYEGDDEEGDDMMGGDPTDDLEGELDAEMGDEEGGEKSEEELFMDLESIVDELQAKFDELKGDDMGGDDMGGDDMGDMGDDEEMKDEFDLATVREYVEKVPAGHGAEKKGAAEKADNTKSLIDNMKNDMGGTTANILSSKEDAATYANQGQLKGSGLLKGTPKEDNAGNINTPGAKNGNAFSKKEPGHGAEKKGSAESADNKQSLFRGRR
jgi:hypothetical protein